MAKKTALFLEIISGLKPFESRNESETWIYSFITLSHKLQFRFKVYNITISYGRGWDITYSL